MSKHQSKTKKTKNINSNKCYFYIVILALVTFIINFNTIFNDYAFDDVVVIKHNNFTKQGLSGIGKILTNDTFTGYFGEQHKLLEGGRYRPFSLITFALEHEFFGLNPAISHFVNLLIYMFTGILLFVIIKMLLTQFFNINRISTKESNISLIAFIASLLFVVHPVHTEVVANIKGRDELLAFVFSLLSFVYAYKYLEKGDNKQLLIVALLFFFALLSKENAITFLFIIPFSFYFFHYRKTTIKIRQYFPVVLSLAIATGIYLFIRLLVLGAGSEIEAKSLLNNPFIEASISQRYATSFHTLLLYLKLLLFPNPLTVDYYPYHIKLQEWTSITAISGLFIYIALGIFALTKIKQRSIFSFLVVYYLITISIVSNLFINIGVFMSERFLYFPSFAFCVFIAFLLFYIIPQKIGKARIKNYRYAAFTFISIVIILSAWKTIERNFDWKNDYTLFSTDVKVSANGAYSNKSAGNHILEVALETKDQIKKTDLLTQAKKYLTRAIEIYPEYNDALFLLANVTFLLDKDWKTSIELYRKLLLVDKSYSKVYENIPIIMEKCPDKQAKEAFYNFLLKTNPHRPEPYLYLGSVERQNGNYNQAIIHLKKAITLNSEDGQAILELGVCYGQVGNFSEAIKYHEMSLQYFSNAINIYKNLGVLYQKSGNQQKADYYFKKARLK